MSHLEALEADTDAGAEIRGRLRELAALKVRRERELEAAERALATKPDREQAQGLVDLLPQLDVDAALLAEESFREMLAALDFRATYEPDRKELKMRATVAPEFLPVTGDGMSSPLSVPIISAPNWTEVEKIPAGGRACAPAQRPTRQAST